MKPEMRDRLEELRAKHRPPPPPPKPEERCEDCGHPEHVSTLGLGRWRVWCSDESCLCGVNECPDCGIRDRTDLIERASANLYGQWVHRCRHCYLETPAVIYA